MPARFERWVVVGLLLLGAALRVRQYAGGAALWLDELALARNIIGRPLGALLAKPLAYDQVAPPGFLLLEKLVVLGLGAGEWQLRLLPLVGGLVSLALFPFVAARFLDGAAFLAAVALFALSAPQVWYGAEVKPYTTDVAVAVVLTLLVLRWQQRRRWRDLVVLATAGVGGVWLSTPAVLCLAGLGSAVGLVAWARKDHGAVRELGPAAVAWVMASAASVVVAFHRVTPASRAFLGAFWAAGFPPKGPLRLGLARWAWHAWSNAFGLVLGYPWPAFYAALAALGAIVLVRRSRDSLVVVGPIAATLAAALAGQYPFHSRTILFLAPALISLAAAGMEWTRKRVAHPSILGAAVVVGALLGPLSTVRMLRSVSDPEEVRPILAGIRAAWRPGDVLYVHYRAWQAIEFYGPRYGFTRADVRLGGCYRDGIPRTAAELNRLQGRSRVWVLFTRNPWPESNLLLGYLNRIGVPRDSVIGENGTSPNKPASAYLYDFSAAAGHGGDTGAITGQHDAGESVGALCEGGPKVPRPTPGVDAYW